MVDPDVWIWPARSRHDATEFLDRRRRDRFNGKYNELLSAWVQLILDTDETGVDVALSVSDDPEDAGNPAFRVGSRTAFARRLAS